jgi:hypothetical protein
LLGFEKKGSECKVGGKTDRPASELVSERAVLVSVEKSLTALPSMEVFIGLLNAPKVSLLSQLGAPRSMETTAGVAGATLLSKKKERFFS